MVPRVGQERWRDETSQGDLVRHITISTAGTYRLQMKATSTDEAVQASLFVNNDELYTPALEELTPSDMMQISAPG